MCYSFDGTILDRTYAKSFILPIYIDETTIKVLTLSMWLKYIYKKLDQP